MRSVVLLALLAGCATDPVATIGPSQCAGGKCDDPAPEQTCGDARYANGTCDLDLACTVPDFDCFTTFADDATARAWYQPLDTRAIVPAEDPRTQHARAVLDRGWAEFKRLRPVGKLGELVPALVVIEDPEPNAFVTADPNRQYATSAFAVVVHTGLLDHGDEAGQLGVMMHELQHAVALHVLPEVADRTRRYYFAPVGDEPIGRLATEDARAREAGEAARALMFDLGYFDGAAFGDVPLDGTYGIVLAQLLAELAQQAPGLCDAPAAEFQRLTNELVAVIDPLDQSVPPITGLAERTAALARDLRACSTQLQYPMIGPSEATPR